ncbi:MAG: TROVE domain-containing protein, partial [Candidatus Thorarchaeota archaeon]
MPRRFGSRKARMLAGDYQGSDTENYEGMPSWKYGPKERLVMTVLTNTLEPTYYANAHTLALEALDNHKVVLDEDPEFYMKALAYGRREGYMRLQPILGIVYLTTKDIHIPFELFEKVIRTPNDLASFIDLCRNSGLRKGLGQKVKTLINMWLARKISPYWLIKYWQKVVQGVKLAHPKMTAEWNRPVAWAQTQRQVVKRLAPSGEETETVTETSQTPLGTAKDLIDYAMKVEKGEPVDEERLEQLPQIKVYDNLKKKVYGEEEITITEVRQAIHEARLPHEAITGIVKPTPIIWKEIMYKMPYFALLRHLITLSREGVFDDREALDWVCQKISNGEAVERSDILPYRFFRAYDMVKKQNAPAPLRDALELAFQASFRNIPNLGGKGCVAIDVSGSMVNYPSSNPNRPYSNTPERRGDLRFIEIAGTFGVPLMMKAPDAEVLPFDMGGLMGSRSGVYPNLLDRRATMLENIDKLVHRRGGGTDCSLPIRYLEHEDIKVDWFVGITDNEEWGSFGHSTSGEGWLPAWRR